MGALLGSGSSIPTPAATRSCRSSTVLARRTARPIRLQFTRRGALETTAGRTIRRKMETTALPALMAARTAAAPIIHLRVARTAAAVRRRLHQKWFDRRLAMVASVEFLRALRATRGHGRTWNGFRTLRNRALTNRGEFLSTVHPTLR